jgi:thioredoxin-related protein
MAAALVLCACYPLPALAADLVMYTRGGCPFCVRFEREVGPIYPKTREGKMAPLHRVELQAGGFRDSSLKEPVVATPTFILMDDGHEVGRITGYLNEDMFWGLLGSLVAGIDRSEHNPRLQVNSR